jgi:hypothetical protein
MTYEILQAVLTLATAIITILLVPFLKEKMGEAKYNNIIKWVKIAVEAAEQMYKAYPKSGDDKKEYVIEFLENKGIKLTIEELDALIESAVSKLK